MSSARRIFLAGAALTLAAIVWLPCVHLFYARSPERHAAATGLSRRAERLAERFLSLWEDPARARAAYAQAHAANPEWDLIARTFLVLSLANMSLRAPASAERYLKTMDSVIADTLRLERERGTLYFLLPYARARPFLAQPARSQFTDSEIAIMLAARRLVREKKEYRALLKERVDSMARRMEASPSLSAESYPDECWTFDQTLALAAIRLADRLDGPDHSKLFRRWTALARTQRVDRATGLLVSSYQLSGRALDGPEGSSIWMSSHLLQPVDPALAADQYVRARKALSRHLLGFGWAAEWPRARRGRMDVDSGPVIPGLDVSPSSSGLALAAAAAFHDRKHLASLAATLDFAAFPCRTGAGLRYCASNLVGDSVILYSTVLGPLWESGPGGGA